MKLNIISWNINMFKPDKPENKVKIINELNKQVNDEDFIILIESSFGFISDLLKSEISKKYLLLDNLTLTHGGFINVLYNKNIKNKITNIELNDLPFSLIKYTNPNTIYIAGCHLAPFPQNGEVRIQQLMTLRSLIPENENLVIIGDMNIRESETKFMKNKNNALNLIDSGDKRKTWFRSFFETSQVNISSRFDRLFISPNLSVDKFDLFGKSNLNLLSDHLAIKVSLQD